MPSEGDNSGKSIFFSFSILLLTPNIAAASEIGRHRHTAFLTGPIKVLIVCEGKVNQEPSSHVTQHDHTSDECREETFIN